MNTLKLTGGERRLIDHTVERANKIVELLTPTNLDTEHLHEAAKAAQQAADTLKFVEQQTIKNGSRETREPTGGTPVLQQP